MHLSQRETNDHSLESQPPPPLLGLPKPRSPSNAQSMACSPGMPSLIHSCWIKCFSFCTCSMWHEHASIMSFYFILFCIIVSSIWVFSIPCDRVLQDVAYVLLFLTFTLVSTWYVLNKYWDVKGLNHWTTVHQSVHTLCTALCWAPIGDTK